MLNNCASVFSNESHSFFIAIIWRALKACFPWKRLKKYFEKNKIKDTLIAAILLVQELINCLKWLVLVQLWPLFYLYSERLKKVNYIYQKRFALVHLCGYKNMYLIEFSRFLTHYCIIWKGTVRPYMINTSFDYMHQLAVRFTIF